MASYKAVFNDRYLRHDNPNHDPKTGQFTFANGASVAKQFKSTTNETSNIVDRFSKGKKNPRADLSKLSDQELNDILRREEMERRYDTYFNTPTEKKGAKYLKDILAITGSVAGIAVAGLTAADIISRFAKAKKETSNV